MPVNRQRQYSHSPLAIWKRGVPSPVPSLAGLRALLTRQARVAAFGVRQLRLAPAALTIRRLSGRLSCWGDAVCAHHDQVVCR